MGLKKIDLSVVVFGSREGHLLHGSILSVARTVEAARASNLVVDVRVAIHDADERTRTWLRERSPFPTCEVNAPCLGAARNQAVERCQGRYVAFIDGGELWCRNFPVAAISQDKLTHCDTVWRPAVSVGFADNYFSTSDYSLRFVPHSAALGQSLILADNPYPTTFCARREILMTHRFPHEDEARGWNDSDGWWVANLLGSDIVQAPVPETLHYFRTALLESRRVARGAVLWGPTTLERGKRHEVKR